jgi:Protein of unknown function (DUF3747)
MKPSLVYQTTATLLSLSLALSAGQAAAVTFDQADLDPSRVVAVAVPLSQSDRYNLLILEQLSNERPCWQDNGGGSIDPLLLQFDFTKICGRSTDSNGYSIRIGGEDKSLDYRLSISRQGNRLVLLGLPARSARGPALEIAHTQTLAPGLLKFVLNPEWNFAKRTYQGKTLGHIYLARNTTPSEGGANSPYPLTLAGSSNHDPLRVAGNSTSTSSSSLFRGSSRRPLRSLNQASPYRGSVGNITAPIEIPVPEPTLAARPLRSSYPNYPNPFPLPVAPDNSGLPTLTGGLLPVPSANIPLGKAGNESDLITASTPSLNINAMAPGVGGSPSSPYQVAMVNYRYRVYVSPVDSRQQRTVKALVPDSFRSSYQGRPVLQVGAFQDRAEADAVISLLSRNGIASIMTPDQ